MKTFKDLEFKPHPNNYGKQAVIIFENGFGVSVIRFRLIINGKDFGYGSYTDNENQWELAIISGTENEFDLRYDTPITDDVMGHLTGDQVTEVMLLVQLLVPNTQLN